MPKYNFLSGSCRFWSKEYKQRPASLTLEEHFLQYLRMESGPCTKRKIRHYIQQGLDIEAYPFLVYAIYANCSKRIIELLLDLKADPYMEDHYAPGNNALSSAIRAHRIDIVEMLIKHGVDPNKLMETGQSPFHIACLQGNQIILQYLLTNGGNVHMCDNSLNTPLHLAVKSNHEYIAFILLNHGANVNALNLSLNTPLFLTHNNDLAEILIKFGADVNHRNNNGDTPLHRLVKHKSIKLVKLLLNHHANPLLMNKQGRTPIDIAKYHQEQTTNNTHMSDILLQYSLVVKEKYNILIDSILIKTKQEINLNDIIFNFIF